MSSAPPPSPMYVPRPLRVRVGAAGRLIARWIEAVCVALLVADFLVVAVSVFFRYVLNNSIGWSEEVARLLLLAMAFLGAALAYPRRAHVSLAFLLSRLPHKIRIHLDASTALIVAALSTVVSYVALTSFLPLQMQLTLPATGLPQGVFSISLVIGTLLLAAYALTDSFKSGWRVWALSAAIVAIGALGAYAAAEGVIAVGAASPLLIAWIVFFVFLFGGVPTSFSLLAASFTYLVLDGRTSFLFLPQRIESGIDSFVLLAVPFFILAGKLMESTSISQRLLDLVRIVVGRLRGGTGLVALGGMYLFSGISGSPTADVSAVGSVMIDPLRKEGYSGGEAVGILSAATIMGQTVPPSIGMVVLGQVAGLSISTLFVAGFLPAAAMALILAVFIFARAHFTRLNPPAGLSRSQSIIALRRGVLPMMVPLILFGGMITGVITPTEIAVAAVLVILLLGMFYRELGVRSLVSSAVDTCVLTGMVLLLIGTANTLSVASTLERLPHTVASWVQLIATSQLEFIAVSLVVIIAMGAVLEFPALIIFGPLLLPVAAGFGMDPIHFAILLLIGLVIGAFLPPIGILFFVVCAVAREPVGKAVRPVFAYVMLTIVGWLVLALVPQLTTFVPKLVGIMK